MLQCLWFHSPPVPTNERRDTFIFTTLNATAKMSVKKEDWGWFSSYSRLCVNPSIYFPFVIRFLYPHWHVFIKTFDELCYSIWVIVAVAMRTMVLGPHWDTARLFKRPLCSLQQLPNVASRSPAFTAESLSFLPSSLSLQVPHRSNMTRQAPPSEHATVPFRIKPGRKWRGERSSHGDWLLLSLHCCSTAEAVIHSHVLWVFTRGKQALIHPDRKEHTSSSLSVRNPRAQQKCTGSSFTSVVQSPQQKMGLLYLLPPGVMVIQDS